jgi:hypothetical protein
MLSGNAQFQRASQAKGFSMTDTIDYGNLMHDAMRGLIQSVLEDVKVNGLPGAHHFFITFDTDHPDVEIADWLSDRYPGEMTIVIQHEYENLEVTDTGFSVSLSFGDAPEPLYVPYESILTFVDPSVEFGLRFEQVDEDVASEEEDAPIKVQPKPKAAKADTDEDAPTKDAEVVSLDSFRK